MLYRVLMTIVWISGEPFDVIKNKVEYDWH